MKAYKTEQLRNVGLFSHGGAGKTSLSEAMLFNAGVVNRLGRVDCPNGLLDVADEVEEAWGVDQVYLRVIPLDGENGELNGDIPTGLLRIVVGGSIPVVDAAESSDDARAKEHCLGEGRLARTAV